MHRHKRTSIVDTSPVFLIMHVEFKVSVFFLERYKALPFLPLNSHPGSECGTEGLNVSAKCLVQLVFTRKGNMKTQERSSQREPEETHVERAELRPDAELQSFLLRLRSVRWH